MPEPMVQWYSFRELLSTGWETIVSTLLSRFSDSRFEQGNVEQGLDVLEAKYADRHTWGGDLWVDYVADAGDGWDPTFAVASLLAKPNLDLRDAAGRPHCTRRGEILVFGGDLVYPTPRDRNYERRLVEPYRQAFEQTGLDRDQQPTVLAIPGNHDWYDGLLAFRRQFLAEGGVPTWKAPQRRSYFAAQLPADVWLLGVDAGLSDSIDPPQRLYFERVAKSFTEHSRVIACFGRPDWREERAESDPPTLREELTGILKREIDVCIAGDLHHYQHDESVPGEKSAQVRPLITAGGGGAFLHPTHAPVPPALRGRLRRRASFPSAEDSRRYRKRLLLFPLLNPTFAVLPALLYTVLLAPLLMHWSALADVRSLPALWHLKLQTSLVFPALVLATGAVLFYLFRERRSIVSALLSAAHMLAHLGAAAAVGVLAAWLTKSTALAAIASPQWTAGLLTFLLGGAVGSSLVGAYLWVSALAGKMLDRSYASLRIADYKSFLRMHISRGGTLTIFPIGITRVPRRWARRADLTGKQRIISDDPRATGPEMIDMPLVLEPRAPVQPRPPAAGRVAGRAHAAEQ